MEVQTFFSDEDLNFLLIYLDAGHMDLNVTVKTFNNYCSDGEADNKICNIEKALRKALMVTP